MVRAPLYQVREMALRELAELWAPELKIPESLVLRELRLAKINIPRLERGEGLIDPIPPDDELPDPDERADHAWLIEFLDKQEGWREPEFWFGKIPQPKKLPGRPGYPHRNAIEDELRRRAEAGEMHDTLAAEAEYLREWAGTTFPADWPPTTKTIKNLWRDLHRDLKRRRPEA